MYPEKTTDMSQVTGKLDHIMLYTLVMIATDYIGSCNSNYHTITTTMAPYIYSIFSIKLIAPELALKPTVGTTVVPPHI